MGWAVFSLANLVAIVVFSHWETVPFHFIWISLTLLYGFRVWSTRPTAWVLAVVMVTTATAIGWDVYRGAQTVDELNEVPLMAAMFWLMVWHAQRRLAADNERDLVSVLSRKHDLRLALHNLHTTGVAATDEEEHGCGREGCGRSSGGCDTCGSGGCGTCGSGVPADMQAYFLELRRQMHERDALRSPLL